MPDLRKTLLVAFVFFAGCAASQVTARYFVPPARAATAQRYEYTCKLVWVDDNDTSRLPDELTRALNAYGAQGWQLTTLAYQTKSDRAAIPCFERPLP